MSKLHIAAAMALAAMGVSGASVVTTASPATEKVTAPGATRQVSRKKNKQVKTPLGYFFKPARSRGPQAPKKKRPNRLHISKRVRRKHRRAA